MRNAPQCPSGAVAKRLGLDYLHKKSRSSECCSDFFCGDIEIRTLDPLLAKQVLYQLSYTPGLFQKTLD